MAETANRSFVLEVLVVCVSEFSDRLVEPLPAEVEDLPVPDVPIFAWDSLPLLLQYPQVLRLEV